MGAVNKQYLVKDKKLYGSIFWIKILKEKCISERNDKTFPLNDANNKILPLYIFINKITHAYMKKRNIHNMDTLKPLLIKGDYHWLPFYAKLMHFIS